MAIRLRSRLKANAVSDLTPDDVDAAVAAIGPYPGGFNGRGITVCAGGLTYFTNAWVLIRLLRKLGCKLPVQFWYWGEEELDPKMRRLVEQYGVECVDAKVVSKRVGRRLSAGWPLKPFSILHSPFEEVLALDADNVPIRNPEYLFESPDYAETGAIFWPDVRQTKPDCAIWKLMGVPFCVEPEFESGQIVVNKALCWEPLNLAMWMNEEGRADFIYKIILGDKDTFRFAWRKFGFPFSMTAKPLQMLSVVGGPCCIGVMCQHDLEEERLFQHRNMLKWEFFGENPWVPGFLFEGECREFLTELRRIWDGRIGPSCTKPRGRAGTCASKLIETVWLLEVIGKGAAGATAPPGSQATPPMDTMVTAMPVDGASPPPANGAPGLKAPDSWPLPRQRAFQEIRFCAGGNFGPWSDARTTFWSVREDAAGMTLDFAGNDTRRATTARFHLRPDGTWLGRWVGTPTRERLILRPMESVYPSARYGNIRAALALENGYVTTPPAGNSRGTHGGPRKSKGISSRRRLHVFNSAQGIGDHVTALYACVGAANAGREIIFHTRFPEWLVRVSHPRLTITAGLPPGVHGKNPTVTNKAGRVIDLNHDPSFQLRYAGDKARWYADAIAPGVTPARPAKIDRSLRTLRFDFDRYVLLAPFSAWAQRDWPGGHWTRLTYLLRDAGFEVVAIGLLCDLKRFEQVFQQTTALWAIDHPSDWVTDAMLGAACVIGNDSGMTHVAGLLSIPAIALHAHLPPDFLFAHAGVKSISPKTNCTFCRWQPDKGYSTACDAACSALATVGPEEVLRRVLQVAPAGLRTAQRRMALALSQSKLSEPRSESFAPGSTPRAVAHLPQGFTTSTLRATQIESTVSLPAAKAQKIPEVAGKKSSRGMIAVTIGIGDTWRRIAEFAAQRCSKMTGLGVTILGEETMSKYALRKPHHLKFWLFEEFPDAETILYFDADTIFLRPWDARVYRGTRDFIAVGDIADDVAVISEAQRIGIDAKSYFNSGLFVASAQAHAPMFRLAMELTAQFASPFHDQTHLNAARAQLAIPMQYLGKSHNHLRLEQAINIEEVLVGHFRWIDSKPPEMIANYFEHWCEKTAGTLALETTGVTSLVTGSYIYRCGSANFQPITFNLDRSVMFNRGTGRWFWEISLEKENRVLWMSNHDETILWARELVGGRWQGQTSNGEALELRLLENRSSLSRAPVDRGAAAEISTRRGLQHEHLNRAW